MQRRFLLVRVHRTVTLYVIGRCVSNTGFDWLSCGHSPTNELWCIALNKMTTVLSCVLYC